jgi:Tol biopolymer transport system component
VHTLREHAYGPAWLPDGRILYSERFEGRQQIHVINPDGTGCGCLTCGSPGNNEGPASSPDGSLVLFVSDRDHPYAIGGAGGGIGQELYIMRACGSGQTRLTFSRDYATNFYARFSHDGRKILWTTTRDYTWDVVVANLVEGVSGFRLDNVTTLTKDTSWNESHEFSPDDRKVIFSSTRGGLMNSDIYVIELETRAARRVTDHPGWDEHAKLSPDGRKMAWISSRFQPTALEKLTKLPPVFDFFLIQPLFFLEFINQPLGFMTELYLMNADGSEIQRLTFDGKIAAGNEWSPDGTMIAFTSTERGFLGHTLKVLAFDRESP